MNKLAIATATPAVFILIDWANHKSENGYNAGLALVLAILFLLGAFTVFAKSKYDLGKNRTSQKNQPSKGNK